ncbi:acetyl-coenzyme A transporter 1-domain-containing protein [Tricharina praecox]|uniref:acetyl-coenzyme A transporter 1-domain-containing protein n=1 Tax=Tricharina praecox TaxID=43433 RepID=UPI00221F859A|nr:acetyl-coenzyme A transporter 1-domain-containing protein [Tricharina praecox]KAI5840608.1 acetyl-coenzyme A transporter 1-domain-containing protein [Tricharina praecox]
MSFSPLHVTSTDHNYFRTNRTSTQDFELQPLYDPDVEDTDDTDSSSSTTTASVRSGERMNRSRRGGGSSSGKRKGMNSSSSVEFRRGKVGVEGGESSAAQTEHLIARESFSLDHDHDVSKPAAASLMDLSPKDRRNFFLLVLLYFLQGVPMGLAMGSVPFLLKSKLSYGEIGVFTLASYPYSMKLLWSPIVDAIWSPRMGRRKSWIVPVQAVSAIMLLWLGGQAEKMMEEANTRLYFFTWVFFCLVMLCATQDVAVDGWALTLISPENLSYASTAQTVGLTAGQFLSNTVFLAFNSADFSNHYFRSTPLKNGLFTLGGYLQFWGWAYLLVTIGLAVLKKEEKTSNRDGIASVYKTMWSVLKLKHIQTFVIIHLISKIGFQANDAVTNLKLLDKGFTQEDMALTVLIDFPFEIALGYYAGKWCAYFPPMKLWMWGFVGRLIAAVLAQITVYIFPKDGVVESWYLLVVIAEHIFSTFAGTVMFVAISAFHAKIADPEIGGTYMTLLATYPVAEFSCALELDKHRCIDQGGKCVIQQDGYYVTNVLCILIGVVTFWGYIKPAATRLSALPLKSWREYDRI